MAKNTATTSTNGKPATAKAKPAKAAPAKAAPAKREPRVKGPNDLTGRELECLTQLAKAKGPMTREMLRTKTGMNKGWSKLLGASTKDETNGLEGRGFVKSAKPEGTPLEYTITKAGQAALAKQPKA